MLYVVVFVAFLCYNIFKEGTFFMKLYFDKRSKDPIYYVQHGYRIGKKVTTKNVYRIGKHSELLKIHNDPLAYAKEVVKQMNETGSIQKLELTIGLNKLIDDSDEIISKVTYKNIGYIILQNIYKQLGLNEFFNNLNENSKATYSFNDVNRFLTFARIIDPSSKFHTVMNKDYYYECPDFEYQHIERFLDVLYENYDNYLNQLYEGSNNLLLRDTSVCYFDCTNYYSEIEDEDQDYVDEVTGELIEGLRKYGVSKEHRNTPIVQMGLFMDRDGIPLTMSIAPGDNNETKCAIPLEEKLVKQLKNKRFIYCADAGLSSFDIRKFNSFTNRAFIVTQSIKKLSEQLKKAVFNDFDYRLLSNDKPISIQALKTMDKTSPDNQALYNDKAYKVISADTLLDIGLTEDKVLLNGKVRKTKSKAILKQNVIITYSRKVAEYQKHIRDGQIERARNLVKTNNVTTLKKGPNDITRFIKKESKSKDKYIIDEEAIKKEEMYDGYYAIATNLEDNVKDIIEVNSYRYKIEECFRIMKTNFGARPYFHQTREHIIAHFLICFAALLIYRILEVSLNRKNHHFTTNQIIDTIKNLNVKPLNDMITETLYKNSKVLKSIEELYNLGISNKYYLTTEFNKKFKNLKK